jgi:hypothetical protein
VIPPPEHDPFIVELYRLPLKELEGELWLARRAGDTAKIQALESELVCRGVELPERTVEVEKPEKNGAGLKNGRGNDIQGHGCPLWFSVGSPRHEQTQAGTSGTLSARSARRPSEIDPVRPGCCCSGQCVRVKRKQN